MTDVYFTDKEGIFLPLPKLETNIMILFEFSESTTLVKILFLRTIISFQNFSEIEKFV